MTTLTSDSGPKPILDEEYTSNTIETNEPAETFNNNNCIKQDEVMKRFAAMMEDHKKSADELIQECELERIRNLQKPRPTPGFFDNELGLGPLGLIFFYVVIVPYLLCDKAIRDVSNYFKTKKHNQVSPN